MQIAESTAEFFDAVGAFFEEMDGALHGLLSSSRSHRSVFDVASNRLLAALAQGRELQPFLDPEAQGHFAAGLARLQDGIETLARMLEVAEGLEAIREIDSSSAEFARTLTACDRASDSDQDWWRDQRFEFPTA